MAAANPSQRHDIPYTRTLGRTDPDESNTTPGPSASDHAMPTRARASFASQMGRITQGYPWRKINDEETASPSPSERPPIPSALAPGESASTSLPVLPMIVLSIVSLSTRVYLSLCLIIRQVMLGEFLSANVSMPFLLFMVEGL